jgi:hypothetical protein
VWASSVSLEICRVHYWVSVAATTMVVTWSMKSLATSRGRGVVLLITEGQGEMGVARVC